MSEENKDKTTESSIPNYQKLEPPQLLPTRVSPAFVAFAFLFFLTTVFVFGNGLSSVALVVSVIVGLSAIVMVHEFSHFVVAKLSGMKCTEFFVGFGPRIWSTKRGETEYGVKAIPAGGYVRIIGMTNLEEVDPADENRTYRSKPYYQRALTTSAGVISHFVMAFVILWIAFVTVGLPQKHGPAVVGTLSEYRNFQTPAQKLGIRPGDRIVAMDGIRFKTWDQFANYVHSRANKPVSLTYQHGSKVLTANVIPADFADLVVAHGSVAQTKKSDHYGIIGVGQKIFYAPRHPVTAISDAGITLYHQTGRTTGAIGQIFSPDALHRLWNQVTNQTTSPDPQRLSSPVGIVRVVGQAAHSGFLSVLAVLVSVNLSVGLLNLLPLLPFDGGHLAIATYEAIRSRRGKRHIVDIRKVAPIAYAVVSVFIILSLTSLYLDIVRPVPNPFQ